MLETLNLDADTTERFYDAIESAGIETIIEDDGYLPPVDDDALPELKQLEEVTERRSWTPTPWWTASPRTTRCACISKRSARSRC